MNQQEEAAKKNGIALICVDPFKESRCSIHLLRGAIPGAEVFYHTLLQDDELRVKRDENMLRTFLLIDGTVTITAGDITYRLEKRASYVADFRKELVLSSACVSHVLEITWNLGAERTDMIRANGTSLPLVQIYDECSQYREEFKSKKSISRSMIDHHALPDFCMGSNESYGPDRVEKHMHPLLDQFFFSFEENDVKLMIDDMIQPYKGNTLLHIPLGSDHGVIIPDGKKMHYVWIDFMVGPGAVSYLDEVHKKTGVQEFFNEKNEIAK